MKYALDQKPKCPSCNKVLDDAEARDFVVCKNNIPTGEPSADRCGWCDKWFTAIPLHDKQHIRFEAGYLLKA